MIPDSEKAVLNALKIKIPMIKNWGEKSFQTGYFIDDGHITKLRIIYQEDLNSLPDNFGNLANLLELDISCSQLTSLPDRRDSNWKAKIIFIP